MLNREVLVCGVSLSAGVLFMGSALFTYSLPGAIGFLMVSLVIVLYDERWRHARTVALIALTAVVVYNLAALVNSLWFPLPGTRPDSATFHDYAAEIAAHDNFDFGVDYVLFVNWLAIIYEVFGTSYYLASTLSICVLAVALRVFLSTAERLRVGGATVWLFILFALSPALVFLGPAPLREAYELLLLQLVVLLTLESVANHATRNVVLITGLIVVMGLLHKALMFVGVGVLVVVFIYLGYRLGASRKPKFVVIFLCSGSIVLGGFAALVLFNEYGRSLVYGLLDDDLFWSIWHYRTSVDNIGNPNTAYGIDFQYEPLDEALLSVTKAYAYYLFYPIVPSMELSLKEVYALAESWLRLLCIMAVVTLGAVAQEVRRNTELWLLIVIYVVVTFIWSLGTTNYGQAVRHHTLTNWILIMSAGVAWSARWTRVHKQ